MPDPAQTEVFYLWEEGNAPARTSFTSDMTGYYDSYDFRPYVTALTIPEGVEAKGAVVLLAGGIQAGEFFISADGDVNGSWLDPDYIPDELDEISADASACGMIYSFYGRLSVASLDVGHLKSAGLPPTFYCYGTEDPFYRQFEAQVALMEEVGVAADTIVLDEWPHGFGGDGGWVADYAAWLEEVFS